MQTLTGKQYLWTLRVLAVGWQPYGDTSKYVPRPRAIKFLGSGWAAIRPYLNRTGLNVL
jgi:hypothetical protein